MKARGSRRYLKVGGPKVNQKFYRPMLFTALALTSTTFAFQNCTPTPALEGQKVSLISSSRVLADARNIGANSNIGSTSSVNPAPSATPDPRCSPNYDGQQLPPSACATPAPATPPPGMSQPASASCSPDAEATFYASQLTGGKNVMNSGELKVALFNGNGQMACQYSSSSVRQGLLDSKMLTMPDLKSICPNLSPGNYQLVVSPQAEAGFQTNLILRPFYMTVANSAATQKLIATAAANINPSSPMTLTNLDPQNRKPSVYFGEQNAETATKCSEAADPLVVDLSGSDDEAGDLTSPVAGVLFDILGSQSSPRPYSKKHVSWFTKASASKRYFVALPDQNGQIRGINQLFGDKTVGPDGKGAADGFAALGKLDGRRADGSIDASAIDNVIDRKDEVFSKIRFWSDLNGDGIAQANEIFSADQLGIEAIDLAYDANFQESDKYGNTAKYKSVVRMRDGGMHIMFDLWLKYY
jgi:hypothetical protein